MGPHTTSHSLVHTPFCVMHTTPCLQITTRTCFGRQHSSGIDVGGAGGPYYFQAASCGPYGNPPYAFPAHIYPTYAYPAAPHHMMSTGPFLVHPQHMGPPPWHDGDAAPLPCWPHGGPLGLHSWHAHLGAHPGASTNIGEANIAGH